MNSIAQFRPSQAALEHLPVGRERYPLRSFVLKRHFFTGVQIEQSVSVQAVWWCGSRIHFQPRAIACAPPRAAFSDNSANTGADANAASSDGVSAASILSGSEDGPSPPPDVVSGTSPDTSGRIRRATRRFSILRVRVIPSNHPVSAVGTRAGVSLFFSRRTVARCLCLGLRLPARVLSHYIGRISIVHCRVLIVFTARLPLTALTRPSYAFFHSHLLTYCVCPVPYGGIRVLPCRRLTIYHLYPVRRYIPLDRFPQHSPHLSATPHPTAHLALVHSQQSRHT